MSFFKRNKKEEQGNTPVLAASVRNPVSSLIFQDILKENGIPFVCRQQGAGGTIKILCGGGIVPDDIYVLPQNQDKARELYEVYVKPQEETAILDDGEEPQ